ncbi:MAG: serine hydrolase domain-containing protein [Ginsengibacter sp.]
MKIFSRFLFAAVISFSFFGSYGQIIISNPGKKDASVDYKKLSNIDTLINGYVNRKWINGVVTIIVKDGKVIQNKGYGYSDVATKKIMQPNSIFRIASQTKAIVSAGILVLYDEGKISLSDPVSKYLPGFANAKVLDKFNPNDTTYTTVPAKRSVTIKDLLTHTSGIDYAVIGTSEMKAIYAKADIPSGIGVVDQNLIETMNNLGKLPLAFQPGTQWRYGLSIDVLGAVIEVISGQDLETFLRKNILDPLGMNDTRFNIPANKASRLTTVYTEDSLHQIIPWYKEYRGVNPDYPIISKKYFSGGAGLSSTAMDYAVFLQMIMNGGRYNGKQILSKRVVAMMLHNQLDFTFNGVNYFGLGFGIISDKGSADQPRNEGSFDWGGYFGTTYWADPKEHLICLFMTQQLPNSHGDLEKRFEQILYSSLR